MAEGPYIGRLSAGNASPGQLFLNHQPSTVTALSARLCVAWRWWEKSPYSAGAARNVEPERRSFFAVPLFSRTPVS